MNRQKVHKIKEEKAKAATATKTESKKKKTKTDENKQKKQNKQMGCSPGDEANTIYNLVTLSERHVISLVFVLVVVDPALSSTCFFGHSFF